MENATVTRYFLGANSRYGFYSLYDTFIDPAAGDFLWVIKGGPGCGKSSFMKKIAAAMESTGEPVEYIHCSGDPDSLDAVWLPSLHTGYVDGTAPHVMDAVYPAAASLYLDLGAYYDAEALHGALKDIVALNMRYKRYYQRAYDCLAAAAETAAQGIPELWDGSEGDKIRKKVNSIAAREFKTRGNGHIHTRFISALSCKGEVFFCETVEHCCQRVYTLDNELGLARVFLAELCALAKKSDQDMVICLDPLDPKQLQALLFPGLSLAFLAVDSVHEYTGPIHRHLRLDSLVDRNVIAAVRPAFRSARKLSAQALQSGITALSHAKLLHDQLEAIYNPHVDFDGVYALAQEHIDRLQHRKEGT